MDTPDHLESLRSADADVRSEAWSDLIGSANHQGSLYSVTPWIVGPLIDLAGEQDYPDRVSAIGHVGLIIEDLYYSLDRADHIPPEIAERIAVRMREEAQLVAQCRKAAADRASAVKRLAGDNAPDVRGWALRLLGVIARTGVDAPQLWLALTDPDPRIRAIALWQLQITTSDQHEVAASAARITKNSASDGLDFFVANIVLLAADHQNKSAAQQVVRLADVVEPEFQGAWLHHVADSPLEFAATLAGLTSEAELEVLAE